MAVQRLSNSGQGGYGYKSLIAGITPVPSVPTIGTATALTSATATVEFTAPGDYSGATYTATSSPGGVTATLATSPITVTGLSGETEYTFTVTATNATGTSGASATSNSITTPAAFSPTGYMDALAVVTVPSGGLATVTFSAIPSTYTHLQIRGSAQTARGTYGTDSLYARFNGDSGSNYADHFLRGNGAVVASGNYQPSSNMLYIGYSAAGTGVSSVFGASVIDILDYASTTKYKTTRTLNGTDINGTIADSPGFVFLSSGLWMSTSAISSITITADNGNFNQHSQFALYGIRG